jgi:DNA-binding transcriptional ArsR family regulator
MVNYKSPQLDTTFSALADPTRRAIVQRLAAGAATVKELARPFSISLPAISKHLRILEQAGLLKRQKEGRVHHCQLNPVPLQEAQDWLTWYQQFWERQFDSLERYLHTSHYPQLKREDHLWPLQHKLAQRPYKYPERSKPIGKKSSKRGPRQTR